MLVATPTSSFSYCPRSLFSERLPNFAACAFACSRASCRQKNRKRHDWGGLLPWRSSARAVSSGIARRLMRGEVPGSSRECGANPTRCISALWQIGRVVRAPRWCANPRGCSHGSKRSERRVFCPMSVVQSGPKESLLWLILGGARKTGVSAWNQVAYFPCCRNAWRD